MKLYSLVVLAAAISSVHAAAISSVHENEITQEDPQELNKRGLIKNLCCFGAKGKTKTKGNTTNTYWEQNTESVEFPNFCTKDFDSVLTDVKAEVISSGNDAAYESMRDKLIMILSNLKTVQSQIGDPDDIQSLTPDGRVSLLHSAASAFLKCKEHFEAFAADDWDWFFRKASSKHSILKQHHLKVFQCHFNLVRLSLRNCSEYYGVSGLGLE
ncbi:hypothetical protein JCM33374_g864 [Metschnikowia sp. JCM 33374]|nr:hypothetical protein JCM33374_g864 [Metschnikowia sp. JCM 33374]